MCLCLWLSLCVSLCVSLRALCLHVYVHTHTGAIYTHTGAMAQKGSKGILDRILSDRIRQDIRREDSFVTSTDVEKQCCPICNEELCQKENTHESVLRLVCSHVFHQDCLLPWLGMCVSSVSYVCLLCNVCVSLSHTLLCMVFVSLTRALSSARISLCICSPWAPPQPTTDCWP